MSPSHNITLADCVISAQAPIEDIYSLLVLRGGIVIRGLVDPADCVALKSEVQPRLDALAPDPAKE